MWAREVWEVFGGVHHEVEEVIDVGDGATVISVQRNKGQTRHMQIDTDWQWAAVFTLRQGKILRGQGSGIHAQGRSPRRLNLTFIWCSRNGLFTDPLVRVRKKLTPRKRRDSVTRRHGWPQMNEGEESPGSPLGESS